MKNANRTIYYAVILILLLLIVIVNINTKSLDTKERTSYDNSDLVYELSSSEENILDFINTKNKVNLLLAFESFNNSQRIYRDLNNDIREINSFDRFMFLFINELMTNFNNDNLNYWENLLEDINTFNKFLLGNDVDIDDKNIRLEKVSNILQSEYVNNFIIIAPSEINR